MNCLSRRTFLRLSGATAVLYLASCTPIRAPTPAPRVLAPLPVIDPVEVNLLEAAHAEELQSLVEFEMAYASVPGMGLGIVRDGDVVYAKGFGLTQAGTDRPVTTQSLFRAMDLTHTFTATAAMQLVEQGKLELDAPVVEVLPYFQLADERYKEITVRHLLRQTAGLTYTNEIEPAKNWEGKTRQTDDGALERYVRSLAAVKLDSAPGQYYCFSDMTYDILGDVIAKTSGEVYEEYMAQHILRPLGMVSSTFYIEEAPPELLVTPHVIEGFMGDAVVSEVVTHSRERSPSVGLFANITDLNRWMLANLNRGELDGVRILQESSFDEMWTRGQELSTGEATGLGWFVGAYGGRSICAYCGRDLGFHNACYLVPDDGIGVIALGNQFTGMADMGWYARTTVESCLDILVS